MKVQTDLYAGLPLIHGNSGKLQQVFLNLFLNAKDAMAGKGGTLHISTANGDSVQVNISDSGAGIAPEHINKIYDPFFTTKNVPREGQSRGTGLACQSRTESFKSTPARFAWTRNLAREPRSNWNFQ